MASEPAGPDRIELRRVRPGELEEVARLTFAVYVDAGFVATESSYVRELLDSSSRARQAEIWVAVTSSAQGKESGRLLGSVTFCPLGSPYREVARGDEGEFRMLAVSPEARGRGLGRTLIELCLRRSRELGYAGVRMSTMDQMAGAQRLYELLGFARAPEDDWSPVPGVTLLVYALTLSRTLGRDA